MSYPRSDIIQTLINLINTSPLLQERGRDLLFEIASSFLLPDVKSFFSNFDTIFHFSKSFRATMLKKLENSLMASFMVSSDKLEDRTISKFEE